MWCRTRQGHAGVGSVGGRSRDMAACSVASSNGMSAEESDGDLTNGDGVWGGVGGHFGRLVVGNRGDLGVWNRRVDGTICGSRTGPS